MSVYPLLQRFALSAPVLALWITGIIIGLVTWRKHAHISLLAAVAFALQILQSFLGTLVLYWLRGREACQVSARGNGASSWTLPHLSRWASAPSHGRSYSWRFFAGGDNPTVCLGTTGNIFPKTSQPR